MLSSSQINFFIRLKDFLVGEDHVPKYQRMQHHQEFDTEDYDGDSDEDDTDDSTPHNLSFQSSGVSSPDPTPPSAPQPALYPVDQLRDHPSPPPYRYGSGANQQSHYSKQFHTTYN